MSWCHGIIPAATLGLSCCFWRALVEVSVLVYFVMEYAYASQCTAAGMLHELLRGDKQGALGMDGSDSIITICKVSYYALHWVSCYVVWRPAIHVCLLVHSLRSVSTPICSVVCFDSCLFCCVVREVAASRADQLCSCWGVIWHTESGIAFLASAYSVLQCAQQRALLPMVWHQISNTLCMHVLVESAPH
jgi:hypothetical protein